MFKNNASNTTSSEIKLELSAKEDGMVFGQNSKFNHILFHILLYTHVYNIITNLSISLFS